MGEERPKTENAKASDVRQNWAEIVNRVSRKEARVLVEKSGVPVVAIVSADDLRRLREFDAERERQFAILDEMRGAFKDVPPEEIEREVTRAIAEVRAENRQRGGATAKVTR